MIPTDDLVISELITPFQAHGVCDVVLCPSSRDASSTHALSHYLTRTTYHSITDERNVGFCASGLALATYREVVVCCTSDIAVANLHPAVAEVHYQSISLVTLSADRSERWIGQWIG